MAAQLAVVGQEVAELAPTAREVADLQVREKDTHDNAHEVEEKRAYIVEAERLQKERGDFLRAVEELHTRIDLAR